MPGFLDMLGGAETPGASPSDIVQADFSNLRPGQQTPSWAKPLLKPQAPPASGMAPAQPLPYIAQGSIPGLLGTSGNAGLWGTGMQNIPPGVPGAESIPPTAMPASGNAPQNVEARGSDAPGTPLSEQPGNLYDKVPRGPMNGPETDTGQTGNTGSQILPKGSLLDRLSNWRDNNRTTLLALAGGLAGAQSIGQGLGRGFSAAAAAAPLDRQYAIQNNAAQWLAGKGLPQAEAMAIATNPALMNQVIPLMMGAKPWSATTVNTGFGSVPMFYNPYNPSEAMVYRGGKFVPVGQGGQQPTQATTSRASTLPRIVSQGGVTYQLQPDGSYKSIGQ